MHIMKRPKIPMFNILRCIAIFCVVFAHMDSYTNITFFEIYDHHFALIGLVIFFFISGFLVQYNNKIESKKDVILSIQKRAKRIYPLFWLSILITIILDSVQLNTFPVVMSTFDLFIVALGLQGIFTMFSVPYALWYIGVILIFYLISYFLIYYAENLKQIIIDSIIIFLLIFLVRREFGVIHPYVLMYYFAFIAGYIIGFICNSRNINYQKIKSISITSLYFICGIYLIYFLSCSILVNKGINKSYISKYGITSILNSDIFKLVLMYDVVIFFVLVLIGFIIYNKSSYTPKLDTAISSEIYSKLAYSSYAVYLFHIQILSLIEKMLDEILFEGLIKDYLMLILSIPVLFTAGYEIQKVFDRSF